MIILLMSIVMLSNDNNQNSYHLFIFFDQTICYSFPMNATFGSVLQRICNDAAPVNGPRGVALGLFVCKMCA